MPQAIAAWIVEYAGVSLATAELIVTAAIVIGTAAYNAAQQRAARNAARDSYNANLTDHQVMIRSAISPRNVVYGRDKVSGPIVFGQSTGDKGQYLHLVIALAGHECDAIEKIYFNEVELPDPDADGFITSGQFFKSTPGGLAEFSNTTTLTLSHTPVSVDSVTGSTGSGSGDGGQTSIFTLGTDYTRAGNTFTFLTPADTYAVNYSYTVGKAVVRVKKHLGGAGQNADAALVDECGPNWTTNHVGTGVCYLYVRLEYDTDVFGQIGIPNIAAVVRGKKVYDSRTTTTAWTDNAALCAADYLRDPLLGLGCSAAEVPDAERDIAANICDETVALGASGPTQSRYTTNGTLSTGDGRRANLEALLAPMAGSAVWVQGRWLLRAGAHRSSEFTLDETWIAQGPKQIIPRARRSDLFNAVTGTFIDPTQGYAQVQIPPVLNPTYEADDGGKRISTDMTMAFVNDTFRAQRLAKITLERARQAVTLKLTCNLRAYDTLPTQVGTVNLARYGYVGKLFEVRERTYDPTAATVSLTLVETASSVWDWNYGEATTVDPAPDTSLPDPFTPPASLTGLVVNTGTAQLLRMADGTIVTRGLVQWNPSADVFVQQGGSIEVQWKLDDAPTWQNAISVSGDSVETYIAPLDDRRVTLVRVRAVNSLGRASGWSSVAIVVVGKTQAPANVAGFTATVVQSGVRFNWTPETETDYADTELRLGSTWSTATRLVRGAADTWTWLSPALGTYTVLAKHHDTSDNESVTAASVGVVVDLAAAVQWSSLGGKPLDPYNMVVTPQFEAGTARGWLGCSVVAVTGHTWTKALAFTVRDVFDSDAPTPMLGDTVLYAFADLDATLANYYVGFGAKFYDSTGAAVAFTLVGGIAAATGWTRVGGTIAVPAGAVGMLPWLTIQGFSGFGTAHATNLYIGRAEPGATATSDLILVGRGTVQVVGNSATKISGSIGWGDGDAYSVDSFTGGAYASAVAGRNDCGLMFGLNSDPTTDESYTSLDYAWFLRGDGLLDIWENGGNVASAVSGYNAGDALAMSYDGSRVIYSRNGTIYRTVAAAAGKKLFFDSSFETVGGKLTNIRFGPLSDISGALAAAAAAATAASNAQTSANSALSELTDISSDSILTPVEKPTAVRDYSVIITEQAGIDAQATNYAVTTEKSAYDSAVSSLTSYLAGLTTPTHWDDLSGNTNVTGSAFRSAFITVYTARQALLDKISANAKARLGNLAVLNTVDTAQIAPSAATDVYSVFDIGPLYFSNAV